MDYLKIRIRLILLFSCGLILMNAGLLVAQEWGNTHISFTREVGNQFHLSDFQLGSEEKISDNEGHGLSIGRFINNDGVSFFLVSAGITKTNYQGTVEDGVEFSFAPNAGSGYETLSSSNNIFYEVDLQFTNPFISLSYTNWNIVRYSIESNFLLPSTFGFGLVFQKAEGKVDITGIDDTLIASASYESGIQRFYHLGWSANYEFLFISLLIRNVTSPVLNIDSCNVAAVGETACDRIEAATGNRNQSTQLFTGGVLEVGMLF
jgi:hypothetical protein